jgi:hypothetical protein
MVLASGVDLIADEDVATDFAVVSRSEQKKKTFFFFPWSPIRCWAQWGRLVGCFVGCSMGCYWTATTR